MPKETGKKELVGDELKVIYEDLVRKLSSLDAQVVEIANNWPDIFLERIIESFFGNGKGRILYVDVSLDKSLVRLKDRDFPPPEAL